MMQCISYAGRVPGETRRGRSTGGCAGEPRGSESTSVQDCATTHAHSVSHTLTHTSAWEFIGVIQLAFSPMGTGRDVNIDFVLQSVQDW